MFHSQVDAMNKEVAPTDSCSYYKFSFLILCFLVLFSRPFIHSVTEAQQKSKNIVSRAIKIRRILINQHIHWIANISKEPQSKAMGYLGREINGTELLYRQVETVGGLRSHRFGPHVLDWLLALNDPGSVANEDLVSDLRDLGYSFSSALAWEIKKRRNAGEPVGWLKNLLRKLEGKRANTFIEHIEKKPPRKKPEKMKGSPIRYAQIPAFFRGEVKNKQDTKTSKGSKQMVLDLDTRELVEWPGPELPNPGSEELGEKQFEKILQTISSVARKENLLVFSLELESLILPSRKWKLLEKGLLQGAYREGHLEKRKRPYVGGPGFREGMRMVVEISGDQRIVFKPYQVPDEYGFVMAYAIVDAGDKTRVAPPVDPVTMYSQYKKLNGDVLAYSHLKGEQINIYHDLRQKAIQTLRKAFPEYRGQINRATARKLEALGTLGVVTEADRLIKWLSADAPSMDVHPARKALAKIGTITTARERAMLEKSVPEKLLDAHMKEENKQVRKRIRNTLNDIYGDQVAEHLLKKQGQD